jgi:signal transduction histidine kinase
MQIIEKTPDLASRLQSFDTFSNIDTNALQWLVDRSEYRLYETGDALFKPGQAVLIMQIIVQGEYIVHLEREGENQELGTWGTGYITGVLPFSRMKETRAEGVALEPTYVLELHRDFFTEMVTVSYKMVQNLVAIMSNRIRDFTQLRLQDEKLMSLGRLSAGLAHELNNPASAMVRSAKELRQRIHYLPERFKSVITMRITEEQTDAVNEILFSRIEKGIREDLSTLQRSEEEDDILDWLDGHEVENGEDLAETFVDFGIGTDDLDQILEIIKEEHLHRILWWVESTLRTETIVREIGESADRIASLIKSIKAYSHSDRSKSMELMDIHEGLYNTVMIMKHKMKAKDIQIEKEVDKTLPKIRMFPGQINQVWTNIIDNAIDAMPVKGTLKIKTYKVRNNLCVDISDTGTGIPEELISRIYDPFFTTKGIGEGTGIGLDMVKKIIDRHKGDIKVESEPGNTTFTVCLPIHS